MRRELIRAGVSRWRQIGDALVSEIELGVLAPNKKLPRSEDLAQRFGVNRHTVLRALSHLQAGGFIRLERGRGTYAVVNPIEFRLGATRWFEESLLESNRTPSRSVLSVLDTLASESVARGLRIEVGEPVTVVTLLGQADGLPVNFGRHHFSRERFPTIADAFRVYGDQPSETFSFKRTFASFGVTAFRRHGVRIRSRPPSTDEAHHLKMAPSDHVLETEVTLVDAGGSSLAYGLTCYCSSRVELVLDPADLRS